MDSHKNTWEYCRKEFKTALFVRVCFLDFTCYQIVIPGEALLTVCGMGNDRPGEVQRGVIS